MDKHARPDKTTPFHSALSMALSTMTFECDRFTYLLNIQYVLLRTLPVYIIFICKKEKRAFMNI